MVEIEYKGNQYRFDRDSRNKKGYWLGVSGRRDGIFPGAYCRVPLAFNSVLQKKAMEDGHAAEVFILKEEKKKAKKSRSKKEKKDCISIF